MYIIYVLHKVVAKGTADQRERERERERGRQDGGD